MANCLSTKLIQIIVSQTETQNQNLPKSFIQKTYRQSIALGTHLKHQISLQ